MGGRWFVNCGKQPSGTSPFPPEACCTMSTCPVLTVVADILLATAFQVETFPALVAIVKAV